MNKNRIKIKNGGRYVLLKSLKYDVLSNKAGDVVFPAGTENVWCCFRGSYMTRVDENGERVRLNVYRKGNVVAHW